MTETWILLDDAASSPLSSPSSMTCRSPSCLESVLASASTRTTSPSSSSVVPAIVDDILLDRCLLRFLVFAELPLPPPPPPLRRPLSLAAFFLSLAFFTRFISASAASLAHLLRLSHRHSGTNGILTSCTASLLLVPMILAFSSLAAMALAITRSSFDGSWSSSFSPASPSSSPRKSSTFIGLSLTTPSWDAASGPSPFGPPTSVQQPPHPPQGLVGGGGVGTSSDAPTPSSMGRRGAGGWKPNLPS